MEKNKQHVGVLRLTESVVFALAFAVHRERADPFRKDVVVGKDRAAVSITAERL